MPSDSRGEVSVYNYMGTDYLLIYTKAGYLRGGEIHTGEQYNIILQGKTRWITPNRAETYEAVSIITTEKDTPHMMISITDSLLLEWREHPLENPVNYYEPYREQIKVKMEEV